MSDDNEPWDGPDDGLEPPDDEAPYLHLLIVSQPSRGDYGEPKRWVGFATFDTRMAEARLAEKRADAVGKLEPPAYDLLTLPLDKWGKWEPPV